MKTLLSPAYNDARRKLVGDRASLELRPGRPDGREPYVLVGGMEAAAGPGIGEPTVGMYDGIGEPTTSELGVVAGDTVHLDIIDRWGNMVSATPTGGWLQSSPVIPELGFCLGTRLQIAWLDERSASALAPGKRPRSTLSPTLALKDGEPWMAFGTPGGDGQDQWSAQLFLHHVHHGMNLQEAIDCPEFNNDHAPSSFYPRGAKPGGAGRWKAASLRRRCGPWRSAATACAGRHLVGRPPDRLCPRSDAGGVVSESRRQPARHADLRRRACIHFLKTLSRRKPGSIFQPRSTCRSMGPGFRREAESFEMPVIYPSLTWISSPARRMG